MMSTIDWLLASLVLSLPSIVSDAAEPCAHQGSPDMYELHVRPLASFPGPPRSFCSSVCVDNNDDAAFRILEHKPKNGVGL